MLLILTLILALGFLSWPWNAAAVGAAAIWEVSSSVFWIRYSRRGRVRVGVETLVGATASVITPLAPDGQHPHPIDDNNAPAGAPTIRQHLPSGTRANLRTMTRVGKQGAILHRLAVHLCVRPMSNCPKNCG